MAPFLFLCLTYGVHFRRYSRSKNPRFSWFFTRLFVSLHTKSNNQKPLWHKTYILVPHDGASGHDAAAPGKYTLGKRFYPYAGEKWRLSGTFFASSLILPIFAMIYTATSKLCQMLMFFWDSVLVQPMTAIKLYHLSDSLLLSFYSAHCLMKCG